MTSDTTAADTIADAGLFRLNLRCLNTIAAITIQQKQQERGMPITKASIFQLPFEAPELFQELFIVDYEPEYDVLLLEVYEQLLGYRGQFLGDSKQ